MSTHAKFAADLKAALAAELRKNRTLVQTEAGIHSAISAALTALHVKFEHEYQLTSNARLDFFTEAGVLIEAKKGAAGVAVAQQVARYLDLPPPNAAIIIAMRCDGQMPLTLRGKPVFTIELWRLVL